MARHAQSSGKIPAIPAPVRTRGPGDPASGDVIAGRYRLERPIGTGGMATIWEATHLTLNRALAVKFIDIVGPNSSKVRGRFLREARVAAAIRHRNVVDIVDFGTSEDGRPFMAMELLVGQTLAERLEVGPVLSVGESVRIIAKVLSGLGAVHDAGIVHRDLKPENVFLVEDADGIYPKLLDFGVSRAVDPRGELKSVLPTVENAIVGTPQYMSPEQARGLRDLDHRSDIWAVGVMLYELLTGQLPFDSDAVGDIIIQIATADPPAFSMLRPDLAGPVEAVVRKSMARKKQDRYDSARAMRAALLGAVARTASQLKGATARLSRPQVLSDSDLAPVAAKELLDAVGDAYEEGDSGLIDFSAHLDQVGGPEPAASPRPPPPPPRISRPDPFTAPTGAADETGEMPQVDVEAFARKPPIALFAVLGLVTVAAIGGVAWWATSGEPDPVEPTATVAEPTAPTPAEPAAPEPPPPVSLALSEVPEGAEVRIDGVPQEGAGPWELPRDDAEHRIEVRMEDGRSWEETHVASADGSYAVEIPPPPRPAAGRPGTSRRVRRPGRGRATPSQRSTPPRSTQRQGGNLMRDPGF
ncbi:MAG: serine/threonine-protein kinase [Myxococcota bacterium]|nr:serine/threonine-protein kinase [Myxococcota bacterium]